MGSLGGRPSMDGHGIDAQEGSLVAALAERLAHNGNPPLTHALLVAVGHLHKMIEAVRPSQDGLRAAIEFLTDVGHSSDQRRQEWVLLADVLGVSTLVEAMNSDRPAGATPNTLAGPFYRAGAPLLPSGANLSRDGRGEPLAVSGRIVDLAGQGVGGATVEVWHASGEGLYENQEPDLQPDFNLRGQFLADDAGRFAFASVRPGGYYLPEDGPVGRLLNGLGYRLQRPAHLHFRVAAAGYQTLTTHVFDRDDPAIGRDALFGVRPELLGTFVSGGTPAARHWSLDLVLVLAAEDRSVPGNSRQRKDR